MKYLFIAFLSLLLLNCQNTPTADYLFHNGPIYTLETSDSQVEALAVRKERIIFTGTYQEAQKYVSGKTRIINLEGDVLMPGFTDAHVHPMTGGMSFLGCNLYEMESPDSILTALKNYAESHLEKEWIRGHNFWLSAFPNGNPRKEWLDSIIPDRPVYISSSDAHSVWVNSKALELAGITAETPNPDNGVIERDANGEPSGTLREEAMRLVEKLIPPFTKEEWMDGLRRGLEEANSLGITNMVEAKLQEKHFEAYLEMAKNQELTAHINLSIYGNFSEGTKDIKRVLDLNEQYQQQLSQYPDLRVNQVKLFMDGVVEGKTAAMLEPYEEENHGGFLNAEADTAIEVITAYDRAGLQIHVHAIGDKGIRTTLDAFEHARQQNGIRDSRHHIAHLHVIHPDDIPRFAKLDVLSNFQALWATWEDSYMTDLNYPFLGEERVEWQYPMGSIARSGGRLVFGSDWNVSTMSPFEAMQVAVTRRGPDNVEREPWTPQHLVDVKTVVEGYTKNGAYLTFRENECGTLTVGKLADLIILNQDVMNCSKFKIFETKVLMTMFRGKVVYGGATF